MSALAGVALGVLLGVVIFWLIYSVYWRRWRGYLTRDMAHLQAKVKSVEATNIGLERQLTAQKTDLTGMRSKINALETENRLARSRIEGYEAEKQALSEHLNTLRGELATYQALAGPEMPRLSAPHPVNGNGQVKPPANGNGASAKANGNGHAKANGNGHLPAAAPKSTMEEHLAALFALSQEVINTPIDTPAHKNGTPLIKARATAYPSLTSDLPPEQLITPEIIIPRPHMAGDRLEIIQGIGPALLKRLHQEGIDSFRVLASMTPERLKEVAGPRLARLIDEKKIIDQAKRIVGE